MRRTRADSAAIQLSGVLVVFVIALLCGDATGGDCARSSSGCFSLAAGFTETMITLDWEPPAEAAAFDIYADYGNGFVRVNPIPVTSRPRYSFFWVEQGGRKKRVVKGRRVRLYVQALTGRGCDSLRKACTALCRSDEVRTRYFAGFSRALDRRVVGAILRTSQRTQRLAPEARSIGTAQFTEAFPALARAIDSAYRKKIDPLDEGACVPFSTLAAKYLSARGVPCYRVQGVFISQFHSFNMLVVDSVEYILDFTADQFLPRSAPVLMPADWRQIDSTGAPTRATAGISARMYQIEKIWASDRLRFTDTPDARLYRSLLDSLLRE